jgi:hypothetical protein|tara:strand:- start:360 stop:623 length:264 start_codon:yes stop_codon:yes gene_type:complete
MTTPSRRRNRRTRAREITLFLLEQEPENEIEYTKLCELVARCGIKVNRNNLCLFLKKEIDSGLITKSKRYSNNRYIHTWKLTPQNIA